jgi:hypothetical protein
LTGENPGGKRFVARRIEILRGAFGIVFSLDRN